LCLDEERVRHIIHTYSTLSTVNGQVQYTNNCLALCLCDTQTKILGATATSV